jgi:hypothetical protein
MATVLTGADTARVVGVCTAAVVAVWMAAAAGSAGVQALWGVVVVPWAVVVAGALPAEVAA